MTEPGLPAAEPVQAASASSDAGCDRIILVTGMSGAGRSTALKALEDMGYEAVDNLPLSLLPSLVAGEPRPARPIAIGIDVRTRDFDPGTLLEALDRLDRRARASLALVFLDCEDEVLRRRFTETRRRHPLVGDRSVSDGIRIERERLAPLQERADLVLDTSHLRPADLGRLLAGHFGLPATQKLALFVTSFSYRFGVPREADLVFDVRFLDNPHYIADLRPLTGEDPRVGAHVAADPDFEPFFQGLTRLLLPLLPRYEREGKSYLTIAIGCTGGRHRSVYVAARLAEFLAGAGTAVTLAHRDVDRGAAPPARNAAKATPRDLQ